MQWQVSEQDSFNGFYANLQILPENFFEKLCSGETYIDIPKKSLLRKFRDVSK